MSSTELYIADKNGDVRSYDECARSGLGGALVWQRLSEKYFGKYSIEQWKVDNERRRQAQAVGLEFYPPSLHGWHRAFALQHSTRISDAEWFVLRMTGDRSVVMREHFEHAAKMCEAFYNEHQSHFGFVATVLRLLLKSSFNAFCMNQTSVNPNPWWVRDEGDSYSDGRPYNIFKDENHIAIHPGLRDEDIAAMGNMIFL